MKVNCAYKFELFLKPEQRAKCAQFVGNCRYVYNKAVEIQLRQLETKQPFVSYKELASQLVGWKKDDSSLWLSQSPAQTLQQTLKDLDRGLMRFKQRKGGMVRYKARGDGDSFRLPQLLDGDFDEANARIRIPKIGFVRSANHATFREKSKISRFPLKPDAGMYPSVRKLRIFSHRQHETVKSALTLALSVPFS